MHDGFHCIYMAFPRDSTIVLVFYEVFPVLEDMHHKDNKAHIIWSNYHCIQPHPGITPWGVNLLYAR